MCFLFPIPAAVFIAVAVLLCVSCQSFATEQIVNITLREQLKTARVMLCTILKQEQLYVDEWLEYHRFLGYDYAELYDNGDYPSPYLAGLHEKYGDFVNVTYLPGQGRQITAYRSCVKRNLAENVWSTFIDADEFVVLRKHNNIKDFLHDVAPDGGAVVLNWSMFGGNTTLTHKPGPVVVRFIHTTPLVNQHLKSTAYVPHILHPSIHNCVLHPGFPSVDSHRVPVNSSSPFLPSGDREIANVNHYNLKSLEEFMLKRHRGRASSTKNNALYHSDSVEAHVKITHEFYVSASANFSVTDTFARDFYLKHHLGLV